MAQCLVSFGANLGTRESAIAAAARELSTLAEVANFRASRLYETPPIGGPIGQEPFLNGVAAFDTTAGARQVLAWLQDLENRLGRVRDRRWAARSIDLDVVLHGNLIGGASDLTVPHPRYTARRFVLRPACDVAADYRDPRFGWTLRELAQHLESGNASMALLGSDAATRADLCDRLSSRFGIRTFAENPFPSPMAVIANAPAVAQTPFKKITENTELAGERPIVDVEDDSAWVSAFVGPLTIDEAASDRNIPRLIARMQWTRPEQRWPAPHNIWPSTSRWPEYRLEVDDLDWAAGEVASALDSMRCPIKPITEDGNWWC
ncbi:MAG TPA: 2-amino-4-hydroxy-6-hydroxymethyldihydropteridine diphosphokinase [Planctomycetaceae bacterium]|nr:2-amino-4-hydroxy-6-hydroxymethyldihydropteridine diphosphokinase [Planctomycetaceae bacterium]